MSASHRPILSVGAFPGVQKKEFAIELGVYDVLLPCRHFLIDHKVAEAGRLSITAEFMLRLVRLLEGVSEVDAAAFFGFDQRDMSFVMSEVEDNGYVVRKDGRLWLTTLGGSLFRDGETEPEIYTVERRRDSIGFDLIAIAPQERKHLDEFELRLPELAVSSVENIGSAARAVPESFKKHYVEVASRSFFGASAKRSLYSVDSVDAADRFSVSIRFTLTSSSSRPSLAEADLSSWRTEYEREDREPIVRAVSKFASQINCRKREEDEVAFEILCRFAPEFLKNYARQSGFAAERFLYDAGVKAGDIRSDRPTVPILGSLFTIESSRRLFELLSYGLQRDGVEPSGVEWLVPMVPYWGATSALGRILQEVGSQLDKGRSSGMDKSAESLAFVVGKPPRYVEAAFASVARADTLVFPSAMEIFLVRDVIACAIVHTPIGSVEGAPVPLGFGSFEPGIVGRVQAFLDEKRHLYSGATSNVSIHDAK